MTAARISLHQVPPLRVPMGYFLAAPWFGIAAGLFLLVSGAGPWTSRWHPVALGATHLLVLGCMAMIMMGALVQLMPVISAAAVPGARRLSPWIRLCLGSGAVALALGLAGESHVFFWIAGPTLTIAFGLFLVPLAWCLVRRIGGGASVSAIRMAAISLLVTVALGLLVLAGHISPEIVPGFRGWTTTHAGFGLTGWTSILIMAVSFQVIPMFHVAPDYPRWLTRGLPLVLLVGLLLHDKWTIGSCLLAYVGMTLFVLHRRKRRAPDVTVRFWQLAMTTLAAGVITWWLAPVSELLLGVVFVVGFALTVMIGMLHKIVPFLVFLHLQRACLADPSRLCDLPSMHQIIPVRRARWQLRLHAGTVAACTIAALAPEFGRVAALALAMDFALLLANVWCGYRCYRDFYPARTQPSPASEVTWKSVHG